MKIRILSLFLLLLWPLGLTTDLDEAALAWATSSTSSNETAQNSALNGPEVFVEANDVVQIAATHQGEPSVSPSEPASPLCAFLRLGRV